VINASSTVQDKRTVEVSVSASGFSSSILDAVVEPPAGSPKALEVTLLPDVIIPEKGATTKVTVTIVDSYGKPAKARSDLIVTLSSSNLQLVDVSPRSIKIPQGSYSVSANVVSTGTTGSAIITASASNLKTDSATVKVSGAKSEKLTLWTQSSFVNGDSGLAFIGIVDSALKPVKASEDTTIKLYSSNTSIVKVTSSVEIKADEWMTTAAVTCVGTGTAKIFAMADSLTSATISVTGIENSNTPVSLKVYTVATYLPADGEEDTYVAIQTVDSSGKPTMAGDSATISIFSSNSAVIDLNAKIDLDSESSVGYVEATPLTAGTAKITAGSSDLSGSDVTVNVYAPQATTVTIISPPIPADGEVEACLISLNSGVPAQVSESTLIQLSSTDTQIADVESSAVLSVKSYWTLFTLNGRSPGQFSLTAIGSGLPASSSTLTVYEVRPSVFEVSYVTPLAQTQFPIVVQTVSSLGVPVVSDTAITVNLASSNTTVAVTTNKAVISAEYSDTLTFGSAYSEGDTVLTFSSGGFNALTLDLTADSMVGGLKLSAVNTYNAGGSTKITAEITLDDKPVSGVKIAWSGSGVYATETTTDSKGKSDNVVTLSAGVNVIAATASVPGFGELTAQKKIIGVRQYTLEVASNIGTEIDGSGNYPEGAIKTITAPSSIELTGILGILGVNQVFKQWTGVSESTNNTVEVVFTGESKQLALLAEYDTDYMGLFMRIGLMTVVFGVVVVGLTLWKRRSE